MFTKKKLLRYADKKALELADQIDLCDGDEAVRLEQELDHVLKMRAELKKPRVSKEVMVEIIKVLGMAGALGAVIWYDSHEHCLPKTLERWLPSPHV